METTDTERLNWLIAHSAWIGWTRDDNIYRVWVLDANYDHKLVWLVCGWSVFFNNPRDAIDAAMKANAAHEPKEVPFGTPNERTSEHD